MEINFWFWLSLVFFAERLYFWFRKPEISIEKALDYLKENLIRLIVFYQSNYSAGNQIELVKKWMEQIKKDDIHPEQKKLFKKYVEEW